MARRRTWWSNAALRSALIEGVGWHDVFSDTYEYADGPAAIARGYRPSSGTLSMSAGDLLLTNDGAAASLIDIFAAAKAGAKCRLHYTARRGTSSSISILAIGVPSGTGGSVTITSTSNVTGVIEFTAPTDILTLRMTVNQAVAGRTGFLAALRLEVFGNAPQPVLLNKRIVVIGDSIIENGAVATRWPTLLRDATGAIVTDGGFGGCRMTGNYGGSGDGPYYEAMSGAQLSGYIASGDFSALTTAAADLFTASADDNRSQAAALAVVNWSLVDALVIHFGRNDKTSDQPIGSDGDSTKASFKGAVNKIVADVQGAYPSLPIHFNGLLYSEDGGNGLGLTNTDYSDAIEARCAALGVSFQDMEATVGINSGNYSTYMADDSHPTIPDGNQLVADAMEVSLSALLA